MISAKIIGREKYNTRARNTSTIIGGLIAVIVFYFLIFREYSGNKLTGYLVLTFLIFGLIFGRIVGYFSRLSTLTLQEELGEDLSFKLESTLASIGVRKIDNGHLVHYLVGTIFLKFEIIIKEENGVFTLTGPYFHLNHILQILNQ